MSTHVIESHPLYGKFHAIAHDEGISHHLINHLIWEEHILDIIVKHIKDNSTFIDIGANLGCHCVGAAAKLRNKRTVHIAAFEPQPFIFGLLQKNMDASGVSHECHPLGLGSGETHIFVDMPDYEHCKNPGGFGLNLNGDDDSKTMVTIKTLDSFHYDNISVIKIDVEGLENEVLKGAYQTIQRCKPVMIVEILGGVVIESATPEQGQYIRDTIRHIESLNYSVERISFSDYLCKPIL